MDYFKILNLRTEPFSNSPDPGFFYRSEQHVACLQKLELAVRLRRGLNVIIGDIGTGKTTLSRQFILQHKDDDNLELHLILDPSFNSTLEFLNHISGFFGLPGSESEWQMKENIKNFLFKKGVDENRTIIIVIDEGQKLPEFSLEILREFMNYETNEFKLLQVIIFAQNEFRAVMEKHANFADRVNLCSYLDPLSFKETRALINYRLTQASESGRTPKLFTLPAYWSIFKFSEGRPRKIIHLCHKLLLSMIIQNRSRVSAPMVKACFHSTELPKRSLMKWAAAAMCMAILIAAVFFTFNFNWKEKAPTQVATQETAAPAPPVSIKQSEAKVMSEPAVAVAHPAAAVAPPVAAASSKPASSRNALLGTLKISRGETINALIAAVYGVNNAKIVRAFSESNPQVRNLDRVVAGEEFAFPLLDIDSGISDSAGFRIKFAEYSRLDTAYSQLKRLRSERVPVRMASIRDSSGKIKFALLSASGYPSENSARRFLGNSKGHSIIDLRKNEIYSDLN
jgi:general secretion pathway protein A